MLNDKNFLRMALEISKGSKCVSMHVWALIVKDNRIVSTGYNGTPAWYPNCHDYWKGAYTPEHHDWSAAHEIHGEMNAILWAARQWQKIEWWTVYCTHEPCLNCSKNIIWAGIKRIVFINKHKHNDDELRKFIKDNHVTVEQVGITD